MRMPSIPIFSLLFLILLISCSLSSHFSPLISASATSASQPTLSIHHDAASVLEPMLAPIMMEHTVDAETETESETTEDTSSDAADDTGVDEGEGDDGDVPPQQQVHLSVDSMTSSFASATAQVTTTFFTGSSTSHQLPNATYLSYSAMKFGALVVGAGATTGCAGAKIPGKMFQSTDSGLSWQPIPTPSDFSKNGALYASSMVTYGSYLVMQSGLWCASGSVSQQITNNVYYQKIGSSSWSQYDSPWNQRGRSALIAKTYPTPLLWQFGGFTSQLQMPGKIWSTSDPTKSSKWKSSSTVPWQTLNGGLYIDFVAVLTSTDLVVAYVNGAVLYISNIDLSAWTQLQPASSWFGQSGANRLFGSMASIKGTLVYVGGVTMSTLPISTNLTQPPPVPSSSVVYQSDVWISNDFGQSWLLAASNTDTSGYSPRCWPILQVNQHQLTIAGGYGLNSAISSYMPLQDVYQTYL